MTIEQAIAQADDLQRNTYPESIKITWLARLETMIKTQVIDQHEFFWLIPYEPITEDTDPSHVLFMQEPFDEAYIHWLNAQVHFHNNELDRYNASISMFSTLFEGWKADYSRHHMPLGLKRFRF